MFSKVLVPLDRSPLSEQAVGHAAAIARASHAEIDLVLVHEPFAFNGYLDAPWNSEEWNAEHAYLDSIAEELESGAGTAVTHAVMRGAPAEMITTRAKNIGADLIVMTSHGRTGLSRAWLGSVADAVIRTSRIPVLMLRPAEKPVERTAMKHLFRKILVPLDGSPLSADVLEAAISLAKSFGASLTLLQIVPPLPLLEAYDASMPFSYPPTAIDEDATRNLVERTTTALEAVATRLREEQTVAVTASVITGARVASAIVDFAHGNDIDAIAMSTHGRGASRFLLGSVADKVLRSSHLPVLLRRPAGVRDDSITLTTADIAEQLPELAGAK